MLPARGKTWDLGFAKTDVLFNHILDSKKLRSLSGEVRVCLPPRVFFPSLGLPVCAVFVPGQQAGRRAAAALDGSGWARGRSRELGLFSRGPKAFYLRAVTPEDLRAVCPQGIEIFGWSVFGDEGEAQACV